MQQKIDKLTQNEVLRLFNYVDGKLIWKVKIKYSHIKIGTHAGYLHPTGYRRIKINSKIYTEQQLIWLFHYGFLLNRLDHINRIRDDNHIENLRIATPSQNSYNKIKAKNKSSKYKGVTWYKSTNKWTAQIQVDGKRKFLGYFNIEKEAAQAYNNELIKAKCKYGVLNKI